MKYISFIIPCYNSSEYMRKCIDSCLTINDDEKMQNHIYTIKMRYIAPTVIQYGRPLSIWFPNGLFDIIFTYRVKAYALESVEAFNDYLVQNGFDLYVPQLPFGEECTGIADFRDRTEALNQLYDNAFLFVAGGENYSGVKNDFFKIKFADAASAKAGVEEYIALAKASGFSEESKENGVVALANPVGEWNNFYSSQIWITDPDKIDASFPGYVQMLIKLYIPDNPKDPDPKPAVLAPISMEANAKVTSYEFSDVNNNVITEYNPEKDGGYFYAKFTTLDGYYVKSVKVKDDTSAVAVKSSDGVRWEIKPSKTLAEVVLIVEVAQGGNTLSAGTFTGGSVYNMNPQAGVVDAGTTVTFSVRLDAGYSIEKVYLLEDPSYTINRHPMIATSFNFVMPNHNATVMVKVTNGGGGDTPWLS